jgi:hypothetical protein
MAVVWRYLDADFLADVVEPRSHHTDDMNFAVGTQFDEVADLSAHVTSVFDATLKVVHPFLRFKFILGKSIKSLFPGEPDHYDSFLVSLFDPRAVKITGEKKNVQIPGGDGRMHAAQILLAMAETGDEVSYTAFISR